jgi:hypothetical protein
MNEPGAGPPTSVAASEYGEVAVVISGVAPGGGQREFFGERGDVTQFVRVPDELVALVLSCGPGFEMLG